MVMNMLMYTFGIIRVVFLPTQFVGGERAGGGGMGRGCVIVWDVFNILHTSYRGCTCSCAFWGLRPLTHFFLPVSLDQNTFIYFNIADMWQAVLNS